jgi:hypothetical protein
VLVPLPLPELAAVPALVVAADSSGDDSQAVNSATAAKSVRNFKRMSCPFETTARFC